MSHRIRGKEYKKRGPQRKIVESGRMRLVKCPPHEYEVQEGKSDLICGVCGTLISKMVYESNVLSKVMKHGRS
jgi:hypothetical protein